jgi:hypothetical protein
MMAVSSVPTSNILEDRRTVFECHPRKFSRHKGRFLSFTLIYSGGQEGASFIATRDNSRLQEVGFF